MLWLAMIVKLLSLVTVGVISDNRSNTKLPCVSDTLYATILESETHLILHHRNRETTPLILPYHSLDNPHRTAPELKHPSYWQYPSPEHISCYTLELVTPLCGHTTVRNTPHTIYDTRVR